MILNENIEILNTLNKENSIYGSRIVLGNINEQLLKFLHNKFPYGEVVAVYSKKSFMKYAKQFEKDVANQGGRVKNVLIGQKAIYSVFDALEMISVSDDVRAYVTFDYELLDIVKYAATVKSAAALYAGFSGETENVFSAKIYINNYSEKTKNPSAKTDKTESEGHGDKTNATLQCDTFNVLCPIFAFFEYDGGEKTESYMYAEIMSSLVALTDYRIGIAGSTDKACVKAYDMLKSAVQKAYKVFSVSQSERKKYLFSALMEIEVANALSDGKIYKFSSIAAMGYSHRFLFATYLCDGERLAYAVKLLNLFELIFSSEKGNTFFYPDYYDMCEKATIATGISFKKLLNKVLLNKKAYERTLNLKKNVFMALKTELKGQTKLSETIENSFFALGGKMCFDKKRFAKDLYIAGAISSFSGLTFLIENGIVEQLQ